VTPTFSASLEQWQLDRLIPMRAMPAPILRSKWRRSRGSIAEVGFVNPVLVGDDGVMVAGHGRVLAARKLGLAEVPVIVLSHLTPTKRRALMIADNLIATNALE
jgi:hypothetical protein